MKNTLEWAGYLLIGLVITSVIFFGLIWMTIEVEHVLDGLVLQ